MLVSVLIISVSFIVGKVVAKIYVVRDVFFKELILLCGFIKTNICFSKNKIQDIIDEYLLVADKRFYDQIDLIRKVLCLEEGISQINNSSLFYFLSLEEKSMLTKFISNFGAQDDVNEMVKINEFVNYLEERKSEAFQKRKVNAPLAYKISLAAGVVVCIMII